LLSFNKALNMNRRFVSVLFFAVVVAAVASSAVYYLVVTNLETAARKPILTRKRLVAAHTLEVGALIRDADLRFVPTSEPLPPNAIADSKGAIGRGVIATIFEGEPIVDGRLAPVGAGAGLAAMIPPGQRAVALKVDEVVGVAGFAVPGMRVDAIISARDSDGMRGDVVSRTVLQNIQVLSAGQKIQKTIDGKPENAQVVNLLVTPDQAEILSLASSEAKVQLVLRNPLDTKQEATRGTSIAQLFGRQPASQAIQSAAPARSPSPKPVAPPPPPPPPQTVEMFNGMKKSEQTLAAQ
jgi:pilus assembly protein CpaB